MSEKDCGSTRVPRRAGDAGSVESDPASHAEQPEGRARTLAALKAAGEEGLYTWDLIVAANTTAAPRRAWELENFYGIVLLKEKIQGNQWRWMYLKSEPWALDPRLSVREAKRLSAEAVAVKAPEVKARPTLLEMMA